MYCARRYWGIVPVLAGLLSLQSCASDSETTSAENQPPTISGNQPPTITGNPPPMVMEGTAYSFLPSADDPDNDPLSFFVVNLPGWATFDPATGLVGGTPGVGDIATYSDISVGVSDGATFAYLDAFSVDVVGTALGAATLSWLAPTERTDGSPLLDLAGYKIYWDTAQGNYSNSMTIGNPGLTAYVIEQLTPATWYFVVTAFNSDGLESSFSNGASKTIL